MTSEEYQEKLRIIEEDIQSKMFTEAENKLTELRSYKPFRAELSLLTGICRYAKTKKPETFFQSVRGKFSLFNDTPAVHKWLATCVNIFAEHKNVLDEKRHQVLLQTLQGDFQQYDVIKQLIADRQDAFSDERDIFYQLYYASDILSAYLQHCFLKKKYPQDRFDERPWLKDEHNMGFFAEEIASREAAPFVVVAAADDDLVSQLAFRNLAFLGKEVYYLVPLPKGRYVLKNTQGKEEASARDRISLLDRIRYRRKKEGLIYVIANGTITEELSRNRSIAKVFQEMIGYYGPCFVRGLKLSWYGDYLSYVSRIYLEDTHKLLARKPQKRFSVVIPARNSAATLRHTLRTCLEQTYKGSYEIIVSDNSTGQNMEVYDLCQELNDSRIVYLKTPRNLYLPKSFEYAFLHTSGEYILSLGSDDGLMPWALDLLEQIAVNCPQEDIIQWDRCSYAWPGFNGGQQHELTIPRDYENGSIEISYQEAGKYWSDLFEVPEKMYLFPLLYINSCCRRNYLKTLLKKTGRLWDGMCQDVYMGVVNVCLHDRILTIDYPLAVAGLSSGSIGDSSNHPRTTDEEFERRLRLFQREGNVGGYCKTYDEFLLPENGTDISTVYACILRCAALGVLPRTVLKELPWQKMFWDITMRRMDVRDIDYDRKLQEVLYAARQHQDEELYDWVEKNIYEPMMVPKHMPKPSAPSGPTPVNPPARSFEEGLNEYGNRVIDASRYGVTDIHGAVQLIRQILEGEISIKEPVGKAQAGNWQIESGTDQA